MALVALVLALSATAGAAPVPSAGIVPEVVNGLVTPAYPAAGALLLGGDPSNAESWCSGVLIGCRTFLTAAHCVCGADGLACQGAAAAPPETRLVYLQHAGLFRVAEVAVHPAYRFPVADLALVKLVTPVTGIVPARIDFGPVPEGTPATIVGFGRGSGTTADFGIKRAGGVTIGPCASAIPDGTALCWHFTGAGANSCDGDSGGPLFVELPSAPAVAGITSGGVSRACLPGDIALDADVARFRDWLDAQAGADLDRVRCGGVPQAGEPGTTTFAVTGALDEARPEETHAVEVPPGTNELRVALNAADDGVANFDLYVKRGAPPTELDHDCAAVGPAQYAYCGFAFPAAGPWYAAVRRVAGSGAYQLTTTVFGGDPPACGNGSRETGEDCDGADDDACPGGCDARCACRYTFSGERLRVLRIDLGRAFIVKVLLRNRTGAYDDVDPRRSDFTLGFEDEPGTRDLIIPAGDPGWSESRPDLASYTWRGWWPRGQREVTVRIRPAPRGGWLVAVRGSRPLPVVQR